MRSFLHLPFHVRSLARIHGRIPLWLKISHTLFVCLLIPVYWIQYGPANFLWFSDIALLAMLPGLWLESRLVASMMAVATLLFELVWNVDFFSRLLTGRDLLGLSDYMFDPLIPLWIRALSLFHVALPIMITWVLHRIGYDPRAFVAQAFLAWLVLPLSYFLADPLENINWVYGFGDEFQTWMPPLQYLLLLMILFPLMIYMPTHFLLKKLFGRG